MNGSSRTRERWRASSREHLFGWIGSGPDPSETRAGEPLRPLTIPNLVGYLRLAAIPVYLVLAFDSGDGHAFGTAAISAFAIALGDYVDGFLARATGQYSRMGALLDPLVDRLTVLAGTAVCWHFELLSRWALAALVIRELVDRVPGADRAPTGGRPRDQLGRTDRRGAGSRSIFWAQVTESVVFDIMLVAGVVFSSLATLLYVRAGLLRTRAA